MDLDWWHLYAVPLCDRDDSLQLGPLWRGGPDRRVRRRLASLLDESFHSCGRLNHKGSRRSASASAMGMNHALWKINERSGASRKRLAGQREVERALENVETLVAVAMDVRGGPSSGPAVSSFPSPLPT